MKTVIIIQARLGSTRLPGKVLLDLAGRPMLAQQIRRLQQCETVDEIVIATTINPQDDPIVELARKEDIPCIRGSEQDVLSRFVLAARERQADVIARVTADCPLITPEITDLIIKDLVDHASGCDYSSNAVRRSYPRGLDTEVFFIDTLLRLDRMATSQTCREHVTVFLRAERPDLFVCRDVVDQENNADLRWTVDMPEDFTLVETLYKQLDLAERDVPYREMLDWVRKQPDLIRLNAHIDTWSPHLPKTS